VGGVGKGWSVFILSYQTSFPFCQSHSNADVYILFHLMSGKAVQVERINYKVKMQTGAFLWAFRPINVRCWRVRSNDCG
jgi:hypothetical protein